MQTESATWETRPVGLHRPMWGADLSGFQSRLTNHAVPAIS